MTSREERLEREAAYREANREKINDAAKKYREANREKCRERCLRSYHKNPLKQKKWIEANRDKILISQRKYREKNKEWINEKNKKRNAENKIHSTLQGKARKAVWCAIKRGELVRSNKCKICDKECKSEAHHANYENVLEVTWVCKRCHGVLHRLKRQT